MWGPHVYRMFSICTVWFSLSSSFYLFYAIKGSGQCRKHFGEASCMVTCKGSLMLKSGYDKATVGSTHDVGAPMQNRAHFVHTAM